MDTYTRITVETKYPQGDSIKREVMVEKWDLNWDSFWNDLVVPVCLAVGYAEKTIAGEIN